MHRTTQHSPRFVCLSLAGLLAAGALIIGLPSVARAAKVVTFWLVSNGERIDVESTKANIQGMIEVDDLLNTTADLQMILRDGQDRTVARYSSSPFAQATFGDEEIFLRIEMLGELRQSVYLDVRFPRPDGRGLVPASLSLDGGPEFDGAILVVSASDGPMP